MRHPRVLFAAAAAFVFVATQSAAAQGRRGAARYDVNTVQTVSGRIASVDAQPSANALGGGLHVQLEAVDKTYDVHLGPQSFLEGQSMKLAVGDVLRVTGSMITYNGAPALVAASVNKGTVTVVLRDSTGVPLWAAARRGRPRLR